MNQCKKDEHLTSHPRLPGQRHAGFVMLRNVWRLGPLCRKEGIFSLHGGASVLFATFKSF